MPYSVLAGFSCGMGAMMLISQLRIIFGLSAPQGGWGDTMLTQLVQVIQNISHAQSIPAITAVAVAFIASLALFAFPRSPAPLFGVLGAVLLAHLFGWQQPQIGALPIGIPSFTGFHWEPSDMWTVLPQELGLVVVSSVNLLITSRVVAHFAGRRQHTKKHDADLELGAYGIANLLAGVTAWMGVRLLDWSAWRRLPKMRGVDALAFVTTAVSTLIVNAIAAVAIGCACFYCIPCIVISCGVMSGNTRPERWYENIRRRM